MKRNTFYNLVILALFLVAAALTGCGSPSSTRQDAAKDFAQETSVATFDGHEYLIWVHGAYKMNDYTYVSGITHSASCKNPEHKQSMVSATPTPSPSPKKP